MEKEEEGRKEAKGLANWFFCGVLALWTVFRKIGFHSSIGCRPTVSCDRIRAAQAVAKFHLVSWGVSRLLVLVLGRIKRVVD